MTWGELVGRRAESIRRWRGEAYLRRYSRRCDRWGLLQSERDESADSDAPQYDVTVHC